MRVKRNECFISHCSDDKEIMENFSHLIHSICHSKCFFFNTFEEENAILAGDGRADEIKRHLKNSKLMIAMITDNYVRSAICLSELSTFWFTSKNIIPILFNPKTGIKLLTDIFGKDIIYINAEDSSSKAAAKFLKTLKSNGIELKVDEHSALEQIILFLENSKQAIPTRPYIGSGEQFDNIINYCNRVHIDQITDSAMPLEQIVKILSNYKNIYILSTTGANLINSLSSEFIPSALKNGTNFTILVPNKDSQFCLDVAELEMPENASFNETRFANEYSNVVTNLIKCVASIDPTSPTAGTIKYGSAFTSLRQTIIMGVDQDGSVWGWMSITLPPKRTNTRTPAIEFSGNIHEENTIASGVYQHLRAIENMAESRNKLFTIQSNTSNDLNFGLEKKSAKRQWEQFQAQAQRQTLEHLKSGTGELIEIAAQHPLLEDGRPALEFEKRLNVGIELYRRLKAEGKIVKIYVPGSVHKYQNKQDIQSLSKAGKQYLLESNIPEEDIYSEEMNDKYKGEDGVYNSADECFVAARIFQDEWMRKLHCICSPNQMVRKQLFYMYFGFLPDFHTVSTNNMFHNLIYELFETIPDILLEDHSWQSWDSLQAQRTRKERKPK